MPQQVTIPYTQEADLQAEPLVLAEKQISEQYALALVNQTFSHYESWRRNNHDNRWQLNDMLYFGQVERKLWDGTNVPRAALAQPIVFDQIEAALPALEQALFGDEKWFEVISSGEATAKEARDVNDHLMYICNHSPNEFGQTALREINYAIKNALQYGNGGVMVEYDEVMKHPVIRWVDVRDVWIDPGTSTPSLDDTKSLIHRRMMTVDDLDAMRDVPGMDIPSKDVLYSLASNHVFAASDLSKQVSEMMRRVQFSPGFHDDLPLPADKNVEVLVYWSKSRIIWVLNRQMVVYNTKNPYGFIPYCFAPCYNVTGRFYGMSFPDVIGDVQLYIQALRNLRLDELSLAVQPPRVRKRGSLMTPSQLKWKPGMLTEMDNPKEDMVIHFPNGATADVSGEIAQLEVVAEKRTGVSALGSGVPRPSNANRTAGGMAMQMQGSASRLSTIVKHLEDFLIVPMLYKLYRMTQVHSKPDKQLPTFVGGEQGNVSAISFFTPVRFEMRAASRMMTRENIQQMFPVLAQYLFQGPFLQELTKTGQTLDYMELLQMLQDATGVGKRYNLIRPMNEQEKAAFNQPDPQTAAMMQKAQMDGEIRTKMGEMKQQTDLQVAQMEYEASIHESEEESSRQLVKLMMENQGEQSKLEGERQKMQIQLDGMMKKMSLEERKAMMEFMRDKQKGDLDMQMARDKAINDHQVGMAQTQSQMLQQDQLHQQQMSQADEQAGQKSLHSQVLGAQKLQHNEAQNEQKLSNAKAMSVLGLRSKGTSNEKKDSQRPKRGK
jgi:hypothetical protein